MLKSFLAKIKNGVFSVVPTKNFGSSSSLGYTPYEKYIEKSAQTERGLYPPEIIGIYFCKSHPAKDGSYPKWFLDSYGIANPARFYKHLSEIGMIKKDERGKWRPTEIGAKELEDNRHILWAHQHNYDVWRFAKKTHNLRADAWSDRVRIFLNQELDNTLSRHRDRVNKGREFFGDETSESEIRYLRGSLAGDLRVTMYQLMKFEKEQGNLELSEKYKKEVERLDKKLGR